MGARPYRVQEQEGSKSAAAKKGLEGEATTCARMGAGCRAITRCPHQGTGSHGRQVSGIATRSAQELPNTPYGAGTPRAGRHTRESRRRARRSRCQKGGAPHDTTSAPGRFIMLPHHVLHAPWAMGGAGCCACTRTCGHAVVVAPVRSAAARVAALCELALLAATCT